MHRIALSSASNRGGTPSSARSATPTRQRATPSALALGSPVTRLPRADLRRSGMPRRSSPGTAGAAGSTTTPPPPGTMSGFNTTSDDLTGADEEETASIASASGPHFFANVLERDTAEPELRFPRGLVVDAADLLVEFLGPNADALHLSRTNTVWSGIVRTSDVWLPTLQAVAPFSTRAVRRGYRCAVESGSFSTRVDWVCHLAVAWRRQLELQATVRTAEADPLAPRDRSFISRAGWWATAPLQLVAAPFRRSAAPKSVVVTGSLGAGKKTFVKRLESIFDAKPVSLNAWATVACPPNWHVVTMEVVGFRRIRPLLFPFFNSASAVIVLVDASQPSDIDDLRRELESWIQAESGRCPVCFVVNHLDRPGALSTESVVERLGLRQLGLFLFNGAAGYPAPGRDGFGGRHVAAIGTCLTHDMVADNTVTTVMRWLGTAVVTLPPPRD